MFKSKLIILFSPHKTTQCSGFSPRLPSFQAYPSSRTKKVEVAASRQARSTKRRQKRSTVPAPAAANKGVQPRFRLVAARCSCIGCLLLDGRSTNTGRSSSRTLASARRSVQEQNPCPQVYRYPHQIGIPSVKRERKTK